MIDYTTKSYGRNAEVTAIYRLFETGRDVSMHGPRRLGKTFVLDRLVDAAADNGYITIKVEVAGCRDTRDIFRELCSKIGNHRSGGQKALDWAKQRLGQLFEPRSDQGGAWYQPFLDLDHEAYFERLVKAMHGDRKHRWALLVDELPIFLKALHDKGDQGLIEARNFMNWTSRIRADYPRVRWMITGSIGIEPLARIGNYMGLLAKYQTFELRPLTVVEAKEFVQDLARDGQLSNRQVITDSEAQELVRVVGWLAPYYLDALTQKMSGTPTDDSKEAEKIVEEAVLRLLQPIQSATFGTWEEHLRKHYRDPDRTIAFAVLAVLSADPKGATIDSLLAGINRAQLTRDSLRTLLTRLNVEGFLTVTDLEGETPSTTFCNPLLRRWWHKYRPQANA